VGEFPEGLSTMGIRITGLHICCDFGHRD